MNILTTPKLELEYYMGIPMNVGQFEMESVLTPNENNGEYHCRFRSKYADFDKIENYSRNGKVFQEKPFYAATIGDPLINDTMVSNRLKGEYGHPDTTDKNRIGKVYDDRVSHVIHDLIFPGDSTGHMLVSTAGVFGPVLARDMVLNHEIPAFSLRIFSTSRKLIDRARGIRMSMGPYKFITIDYCNRPSNKTATPKYSDNPASITEMIGKQVSVDMEGYGVDDVYGVIEIAKEALFKGSDDVKFATEYLGLELEGYKDNYAVFKDGENAQAFLKLDSDTTARVNRCIRSGLTLF